MFSQAISNSSTDWQKHSPLQCVRVTSFSNCEAFKESLMIAANKQISFDSEQAIAIMGKTLREKFSKITSLRSHSDKVIHAIQFNFLTQRYLIHRFLSWRSSTLLITAGKSIIRRYWLDRLINNSNPYMELWLKTSRLSASKNFPTVFSQKLKLFALLSLSFLDAQSS